MCAKFELLLRAKELDTTMIEFVENLLKEQEFDFHHVTFHQGLENGSIQTVDEYIDELVEQIRSDDKREQFFARQTLLDLVHPEGPKPKTLESYTEKEMNTVIFVVGSHKGKCLCDLEDGSIIQNIFRKCLDVFDEVYYDPSSNGFVFYETLGFEIDNTIRIDDEFDYLPDVGFRSCVRIVK